jgi:hypothetical protein
MKKYIFTESQLKKIIDNELNQKILNEQFDENIVSEINKMGPFQLFSDSNQKNLVGSTYFSEIFKNPDGTINLYPDKIVFSSPSISMSGWKLLVFKCGVRGLKSSGNGKVVFNSQIEQFLNQKFCNK